MRYSLRCLICPKNRVAPVQMKRTTYCFVEVRTRMPKYYCFAFVLRKKPIYSFGSVGRKKLVPVPWRDEKTKTGNPRLRPGPDQRRRIHCPPPAMFQTTSTVGDAGGQCGSTNGRPASLQDSAFQCIRRPPILGNWQWAASPTPASWQKPRTPMN